MGGIFFTPGDGAGVLASLTSPPNPLSMNGEGEWTSAYGRCEKYGEGEWTSAYGRCEKYGEGE